MIALSQRQSRCLKRGFDLGNGIYHRNSATPGRHADERFEMKKRLLFLAVAAAAALFAAPHSVQAADAKKPDAKAPAADAKATPVTVNGVVKGAPTGKTFVLASKKGATTVDASAAKIRERGKFTTIDAVKSGTVANAKGTMDGTTLKATDVNLFPRKKAPKQEVAPAK
jgi:hypothetical protein